MPQRQAEGIESAHGISPLQPRVVVTSALIYPLWHLAAPAAATDPWWAWWAVAATLLAVTGASLRFPVVARHQSVLLYLCSWLFTLHLYVLSYVNDMHPFYVVGSVMAVFATAVSIRSRPTLLGFGIFVAVLSAALFALDPEGRKAAYWGGMLTVIGTTYYRLMAQLTAARLSREHQQRLEQRVKERTSELSEANRRLRREMEERARLEEELRLSQKLEALGRLAGGVAHEFNNLLTRIRLYADLLLEDADPDSSLHNEVGEIQKAGRQAADLIQQLLTFSRRGHVQMEVLDLNGVVAESSSMLRHLLGEDSDLICALGEGLHCIHADRGQIEQILVNLALNARDAMPEGGRFRIETSTLTGDEFRARGLPESLADGDYVVLAVSDTGVGMDPETRARAFDPFFSRKPAHEGTGLGLSIVYGIVNQGGGYVRVLSEKDKGARFELYWPQTHERPVQRAGAPSSRAARGGSERILLVEDEADLRRALHMLLSGNGYAVIDAGDGATALRMASEDEGEIDLLITDVVMPRMGGLELVEEMSVKRPGTRVLLMSGHLNHPSLRDWTPPPGVALLPKPFDPEDLTSMVREVLDAPAGI